MPFDATGRMAAAIPFAFADYLELVDTTGRVLREDKKGYIKGETPRVLERLNIDPEQFIATTALEIRQSHCDCASHLSRALARASARRGLRSMSLMRSWISGGITQPRGLRRGSVDPQNALCSAWQA